MCAPRRCFNGDSFTRHKRSKAVLPATRARVEATIAQLLFPDEAGRLLAQKRSGELFIGATYFWRGNHREESNPPKPMIRILRRGSAGRRRLTSGTSSTSGDNLRTILRIIRAAQRSLCAGPRPSPEVTRGTVSDIVTPVDCSGVLREGGRWNEASGAAAVDCLSLCDDRSFFIGVTLVCAIRKWALQRPMACCSMTNRCDDGLEGYAHSDHSIVDRLEGSMPERTLLAVGVSVPGPTDADGNSCFLRHILAAASAIADALVRDLMG